MKYGIDFHPVFSSAYLSHRGALRERIPLPILRRLKRVTLRNTNKGDWFIQTRYLRFGENEWRAADVAMESIHLRALVAQRWWLASRVPGDGMTDRIVFDLDVRGYEQEEAQTAIYRAVRALMGVARLPLVYRTPAPNSLRVAYRIPRMPLALVEDTFRPRLVANACRAAGILVTAGQLELYPQRVQFDRLPLGRKMPILDPETLELLPHANIGAHFDLEMLDGALREVEEWYRRVYRDLVPLPEPGLAEEFTARLAVGIWDRMRRVQPEDGHSLR